MDKKRIVSVLIVLIFALGVASSGILASGFGEGEAAGKNTAGKNIDEVIVGIQCKLMFYEKNNLRSTAYRIQNLYNDSELPQSLESAQNEAEVELNTPWAEAYYEFLEETLQDDSSPINSKGFRLVYIDDNDVPELLIMEVKTPASSAKVYTYYQGRVIEIGEFGSMWNMFYYAKRQGEIHTYYTGFGEHFFSYYVLEDGKSEQVGEFHSYPDLDYDDYSVTLYEIDEESVTEETFRKKLHEIDRDNYESIGYEDAVFVDDMAQLKTALEQEIEDLELKSRLTPQQTEALEAYEAFLEDEAEECIKSFNMTREDFEKRTDYKGPEFTLIYLDDDEIPELAVLDVNLLIYTFADGEVTSVGTYGQYGHVNYVEREGIVFSSRDEYKDVYNNVYKIKGAEEVLLQSSSESWHYEVKAGGEGKEYCVYLVDGKEVTNDEYEAALKVWDEYEKKEVLYADCFLMIDRNVRGNLNQAMAKLVFEENPFFYSRGNTSLSADIKYEASETWKTINGELQIKRLKRYDNGDLYKLSVAGITEGFLGSERKNIYLYVTPDEIYRLWSFYRDENGQSITFYDNDSLLMETFDTDEKLIENGELVCCMERLEDELGKKDLGENEMGTPISEIGKHFSIIPEGERITYSRYDTKPNGETDFYENFVWERGKGLVEYRSGFRAEAEILYIENISMKD